MTIGSSAPWIVYKWIVYRLVVYRVVRKLHLHDPKTTLVAVLLSLPHLASTVPSCLNVKCNIDDWECQAQWLIFHAFPQYDPDLWKNGAGPDND